MIGEEREKGREKGVCYLEKETKPGVFFLGVLSSSSFCFF